MARSEHWLQTERHVGLPLRFVYVLFALWLWQGGAAGMLRTTVAIAWWAYVAVATMSVPLILVVRPHRSTDGLIGGLQVVDALFVAFTVYQSGVMAGPAVWLFVLWVGRQALLAAAAPLWYGISFLSGPFYLAAVYARSRTPAVVLDKGVQQTYLMLLIVVLANWALALYLRTLRSALAQEREDLARKTEVLQRTASDLGARVLELRALQEVAHHLSTSLHLEQTLDVIGRRARDLFGVGHVAILLATEDGQTWRWVYVDDTPVEGAREPVVVPVAESPAEVRTLPPSSDGKDADALAAALRDLWGNIFLILIPLIARGRRVALIALGDARGGREFGERQEQLAESFAFLAATAIENARLYENVLEQRQELEAVLQGIGDAVIVTDASLNVIMVNPVAVRTLRLPPSPAGRSLAALVENEDLVALVREVFEGEASVLMRDITFEFAGEKPRTFQAVASAVMGHGRARAVVTVLRDITAQKELERMKSNFLSVVSHELKTPLHSIKGFVEIIRMGKAGPITDLQADFLTTVKEQTQVLQRMIDDLLVFSRLETGQLRLHVEDVSLAAIAAGVVQKLTPLAEEKSIRLETLLPDTFPDVEGDYMRLEQVLTNLVENAIKFTPAGGEVVVDGEDLGERVRVWVRDTGIGIPPSEQERIFDRFYQVDASERRAHRGTGLGLTICKHIVERHHGRIWVESEVGRGSTFFVELPKKLPPSTETLDFYTERDAPMPDTVS